MRFIPLVVPGLATISGFSILSIWYIVEESIASWHRGPPGNGGETGVGQIRAFTPCDATGCAPRIQRRRGGTGVTFLGAGARRGSLHSSLLRRSSLKL